MLPVPGTTSAPVISYAKPGPNAKVWLRRWPRLSTKVTSPPSARQASGCAGSPTSNRTPPEPVEMTPEPGKVGWPITPGGRVPRLLPSVKDTVTQGTPSTKVVRLPSVVAALPPLPAPPTGARNTSSEMKILTVCGDAEGPGTWLLATPPTSGRASAKTKPAPRTPSRITIKGDEPHPGITKVSSHDLAYRSARTPSRHQDRVAKLPEFLGCSPSPKSERGLGGEV
jgi:hypothetical protein